MANLQLRIDDDLKTQASIVLDQMGLDLTTAVRMYLKEIVRSNHLPFVPTADPFYNKANIAYLEKALEDVRRGHKVSQHALLKE